MGTPRSPRTDFYSILGIPNTATFKDMGKAYKSLVKKWHPDKNPSNKAEAEAKFMAINEAYSALNNKTQEEKFIDNNIDEPTTPESIISNLRTMDDSNIFKKRGSFLSRTGSRRSHTPQARPTYLSKSESRKMDTTNSPTKNLSKSLSKCMSRKDNSPIKGLTTSLAKSASRKCTSETKNPQISRNMSRRGTTPIIFSQTIGRRKPPPVQKQLQCTLEELCHGGVKMIKITRNVITDAGIIVQEEETLRIKLKPGWKKGTKIIFEGKGDEKPGYLPADIILLIDEKRHRLFKRKGDDLEIAVEIPLVKALTGCTFSVPLLGGEQMTLSFEDVIYPGFEKLIQGQGMPDAKQEGKRGVLRITFLVNFPQDLSHEQRSMAVNILKDSSYS